MPRQEVTVFADRIWCGGGQVEKVHKRLWCLRDNSMKSV